MKQPQEIEVWYVLPAIRRELACAMIVLEMSQKEIARKLDITEAAVSQYKSSKRASEIKFGKETLLMIKQAAKRISEDKSTALEEIQKISANIKSSGDLCEVHRKYDKSCDMTCDICCLK